MLTSKQLSIGEVYTREDLKKAFNVSDATINTGIFQPQGHNSVWLFVTEGKTRDRTQYADKLHGETLEWEGQTEGRKDNLIIEHESRDLELLLFYRTKKYEHPGAGFKYHGPFQYVSHSGKRPTKFILMQYGQLEQTTAQDIASLLAEETYAEGGKKTTLINRYERNPQVRVAAIRLHGMCCQACGFNFQAVYGEWGRDYIEVHHVKQVSNYDGEVRVNPATDMAVLCANCHRMIHRRATHPLTIDELKAMLK